MGVKGAEADMYVRGKSPGINPGEPLKLCGWRRREGGGMSGVAVKCVDIERNTRGEGGFLDIN